MKLELINFNMYKILIYSFLFVTNLFFSQTISEVRYYLDPIKTDPIYSIANAKLGVTIQSGRTQVNVRNTYKIRRSKVIAQVNGDESYNVSKIAQILGNELLILDKDFISNNYYLNGIKRTGKKVKFIKGLKLNNTYTYPNGDFFAELSYNIRNKKEIYTLRIPKDYVEIKQKSNWYYLDLLEGWILSDFCIIN